MAENRGKKFEGIIREAFLQVPNTSVIRLPDPTSGYLGVRNISDFIVYHYPYMYFIECKSVHGNTLSIHSPRPEKKYGNITNNQWEGMFEESGKKGVIAGVICWWVDKDVTKFIPIEVLNLERYCSAKSIRYDDNHFFNVMIQGKKKRVFFEYNMSEFFKDMELAYE